MKQKDELAITIVGRIKPSFLGADFNLTFCKCENGGYYIKHFPESLFKHLEIEGITDFKESWRETYPDTKDITTPLAEMSFPAPKTAMEKPTTE